jgi:PAS domain S-box-containing protein
MFGDKQYLAWVLLGFAAALILHGISYVIRLRRRAEESCSPEPIYDFFEDAPAGYLQIGKDGVVIRVNRKECELRGLMASGIVSKHYAELEPPSSQERCRDELAQKLSGGTALNPYHRTLQRPDGTVSTVEIKETLLRNEQGELVGMLLVATDITDRQKTEEHALETASELNALFEAFPDLFLRLNVDGTVLDCKRGDPNDPFLVPEKFLGRSLQDVLPAEAARLISDAAAAARHTNSLNVVEYSMKAGESLVFYECRVLPLYWDQTAAVLRNVTKQKVAERKLGQYAEELERKRDELEATLTAARESTKLKSQFLTNISNEIRTPMNGVVGMLEFLSGTELTAEQKGYAEQAKQSANSLLGLINDILDASKIDAGKLRLERIPFHLRVMIEELASIFEIRARAKGLSFSCVLPGSFPWMAVGDPGRLRQVLSNLLANAIKCTEQGEVRLEVEMMRKADRTITVRFTVSDTGAGIAPAKEPDFFQGFTPANGTSTRKFEDNGLGLAISKQIVELLGGEIGVTSEPGRGSRCWFTAVLDRPGPEQRTLAELEPASLEDLRVLVAGSKAITDALQQLLESWGCETVDVSTGDAIAPALQEAAAEGRPFRLAVVDIDLPDLNKNILANTIGSEPLEDLRLIAMTSSPLRGDAIEFREKGYSGYLQKPIQASTLHDILTEVLRPRDASGGATPLPLVTRHTLSEQKLVRQ